MRSAALAALDGAGLVEELGRRIGTALAESVDQRAPFALLGVSGTRDVGGSATLLGELSWFARRGGRPAHVGAVGPTNWLRLERRVGAGSLLLHGGSDFGDFSPDAHAYREAVLWRYRGRAVIQLPQVLRFSSQAAIDQTARVIERHGAFTLLVRDRASLDLAGRFFACEARLCPDMAFALGPLPRGAPSRPLLMLIRREGAIAYREAQAFAAEHGAMLADWPDHPSRADWRARAEIVASILRVQTPGLAMHRAGARARTERGLDLLRSAEFVMTDCPDAHLLCVLMGIPHCLIASADTNNWAHMDGIEVPLAANLEGALQVCQRVRR